MQVPDALGKQSALHAVITVDYLGWCVHKVERSKRYRWHPQHRPDSRHQALSHQGAAETYLRLHRDTTRRRIVVEDVRMRPDQEQGGDEPAWSRRMVFVSNRSLTQSEAYLQPEEPAPDWAGGTHTGGSPPVRGSFLWLVNCSMIHGMANCC